jgi:hypothetical protein
MTSRARKILGSLTILGVVVVYPFLAMALADSRPLQEAPTALQVVTYCILGLAWTLPLFPVIRWMEQRPRKP